MNKRFKLLSSTIALCFSIAVLCFGVWAAQQVDYSVNGTISYELNDVFVKVETKLYRSTSLDLISNQETLNANTATFQTSGSLANTEQTSYTGDILKTYDPETKQLLTTGETVTGSADDVPINFGEYDSQTAEEDRLSYAYYIVVEITNYASEIINAQITNSVTATNTYVTTPNGIEIEANSTNRIVIGFALIDVTKAESGSFSYNITITQGELPAGLSISQLTYSSQSDSFVQEQTGELEQQHTIVTELTTETSTTEGEPCAFVNFSLTNVPQSLQALELTVSYTLAGDTTPISAMAFGIAAKGTYKDVAELDADLLTILNSPLTASYMLGIIEQKTAVSEYTSTIMLPEHDGSVNFFVLFGDSTGNEVGTTYEYTFKVNTTELELFTYNLLTDDNGDQYYEVSGNSSYALFAGTLEIPSTVDGIPVKTIADSAFASWFISGVVIPEGITTIGASAFYGTYIKELSLPNSLIEIKERAFGFNNYLTQLTIPNNVTTIGACAFGDNRNLLQLTIGQSVSSIGDDAFYCDKLLQIRSYSSTYSTLESLESSVDNNTLEYDFAYQDADFANTLTFGEKYITYTVGSDVYLVGVTDFNIETATDIPSSINKIYDNAFAYCLKITEISVPNSVDYIGESAFWGLYLLSKVTLPTNPNFTIINYMTFYYCPSLSEITIPDSVVEIGTYAFSDCTSLENITIPDSVTQIGNSAFRDCTNLKNITFMHTSGTVEVGSYAWTDNSNYSSSTINFNGATWTNANDSTEVYSDSNKPSSLSDLNKKTWIVTIA